MKGETDSGVTSQQSDDDCPDDEVKRGSVGDENNVCSSEDEEIANHRIYPASELQQ